MEDCSVKLIHSIAKVEVVSRLSPTPLGDVKVLLEHVVVSQLINRHQTLQTRVHVAVKCIILEANNAVLIVGKLLVFGWPGRLWQLHDIWFNLLGELQLGPWFFLDHDGPASVHRQEEVEQVLVDAVKLRLLFFALLAVSAQRSHDFLVLDWAGGLGCTLVIRLNILEPVGDPDGADRVVALPFLIGLLKRVHVLGLHRVSLFKRHTHQFSLDRLVVPRQVRLQRDVRLALHDRATDKFSDAVVLAHLDDKVCVVPVEVHVPEVD